MDTRIVATAVAVLSTAALLALVAGGGAAADPTLVRVKLFGGLSNLPIFAGQAKGFFARQGLRVEIEHEPRQPRRAGRPEVLYRRQAERSGRHAYTGGVRPLGLGRRLLTSLARCRTCLADVKRIEGMAREVEESDQEGEGKDAPQG